MLIIGLFLLVYLGMMLGNLPGLALDRTGIALLAAICLVVFGLISKEQMMAMIDWPTMALLFGMMLIASHLYVSGFYSWVMQRLKRVEVGPERFLLYLVLITGVLSAVLLNDIVCLALVPWVIAICQERSWKSAPFLWGIALAANVGSMMTLIGNPQNILISERLSLSFLRYFAIAGVPGILSLFWVWRVLVWKTKEWAACSSLKTPLEKQNLDLFQMKKGLFLLGLLLVGFLVLDVPRYQQVLFVTGCLLLSRKVRSETLFERIDWPLFLLFGGLFLINGAFLEVPWVQEKVLQVKGVEHPGVLAALSVVLSCLISNVPATMLLSSWIQTESQGIFVAVFSTLAGNLLLVGSIANWIVVMKAKQSGVFLDWKEHIRLGFPVFLGSSFLFLLWYFLFPF